MFLEINAVAVILVAKGQGLMAVINPSMNADKIGILKFSKRDCKKSIYSVFNFVSILTFSSLENASWSFPFIKATFTLLYLKSVFRFTSILLTTFEN